MDRPLRIAHCVESYHPAVGGMQEVVRQLSERIAAMGHGVTVFTSHHPGRQGDPINRVHVRSFKAQGNPVVGYSGETEAYLRALRGGGFDIITLFAAQQWATDLVLHHLDDIPGKKVFVPTGFSQLRSPLFKAYFQHMPAWMRRMDLNIFLSETYQDIRFAKEHGVEAIAIIPNGAAEEEFLAPLQAGIREEYGIAPHRKVIVHVGGATGIKGHEEAVRIFLKADTGDAVLVFVGSDIGRFEKEYRSGLRYLPLRWKQHRLRKEILFLQLDRPRTVAAMRQADLFLFPSRVECSPIVLFEAMAAGIPFLSSTAGNSEEIARWSNGGWTIPGTTDKNGWWNVDVEQGAKMLTELLHDPKRLKAAGENGHIAWKERFTWAGIAKRYVEEYERLLS